MRYVGAFSLVAGSLMGSALLPECASAQSNPYALDRLFLMPSDKQPVYQVLSFTNETEVANYYGVGSYQAQLASDFFAGYTGNSATMLFTRYPELSARAHLYGADISDLTLAQLQAINGTLTITSQGYNFSGSVNLSGVSSFEAAAAAIQNDLNQTLPTAAVTTGTIAPVSVSFTGSISKLLLTVTAVSSGNIQVGSIISGRGIPPGAQITSQVNGTPGSAGVYGLFVPEGTVSSEAMTETYGVLSVNPASSGTVNDGEQVTGAGVAPLTAIESKLSSSAAGSTWLVNLAQTVAIRESMTMTAAPLSVVYTSVTGQTANRAYFSIQQNGDFNFDSASTTYAGGGAAKALGLTKVSGAFNSSPGQIVTSASAWMNNFVATKSDQFYSFQSAWDPKGATPPREQAALDAWAQSKGGQYTYVENWSANTPPIVDSLEPSAEEQPFAATGAAVPEPSTWAMALLGYSGLGLARHVGGRRRVRPAFEFSRRKASSLRTLIPRANVWIQ